MAVARHDLREHHQNTNMEKEESDHHGSEINVESCSRKVTKTPACTIIQTSVG